MILFLDFDGVLHPIPCKDKDMLCFIPRLEGVLRDFPHVQVVISSLWRASHDLDGLRAYFSEDIRPRIIGMTPFTDIMAWESEGRFFVQKTRYEEARLWIAQNAYTGPYVSLDDAGNEFPDECLTLIPCESEEGFSIVVERALRLRLQAIAESQDI